MTAIFTAKADLAPSADQTATGAVNLIASGVFGGASVLIRTKGDGQDWAPLHVFKEPGSIKVSFASGQLWQASLQNVGANTAIGLSALTA